MLLQLVTWFRSQPVLAAPSFDVVTTAFQDALQCSLDTSFTSCNLLTPPSTSSRRDRIIKKDSLPNIVANGGLMSKVGNSLLLARQLGTLTL
jgi:hypothetical protein